MYFLDMDGIFAWSSCKMRLLFERRPQPGVHLCKCWNRMPEKDKRKKPKKQPAFQSKEEMGNLLKLLLFTMTHTFRDTCHTFLHLSLNYFNWICIIKVLYHDYVSVMLSCSLYLKLTFSAALKSSFRRWRQPMLK